MRCFSKKQAVKAFAPTACAACDVLPLVRPLYLLGGGHLQRLVQDGGTGDASVGQEATVHLTFRTVLMYLDQNP